MRKCYYCGAKAQSDEHAPPKQMFKGFPGHRIKVPSCEKHNNRKGQDDTAILRAMLISLDNASTLGKLSPEVQKAVELAKPYFHEVKRVVRTHIILDQPPSGLDIPLAHLPASVNIYEWMRQLTAALVYQVTKSYDKDVDWQKAGVWSPDWLPNPQPDSKSNDEILAWALDSRRLDAELRKLHWVSGWWSVGPKSYPTGIFHFDVHLDPPQVNFRLVFFSAYRWYVAFRPSTTMLSQLTNAVRGS